MARSSYLAAGCNRTRAGRVLAGFVLALAGCRERPAAQPVETPPIEIVPPNIIFVMIDTLRADFVGVYGNPRGSTPTIDAIAAEGVVFDRAVAQAPWTKPSIASLFCSRYPGVHQVLILKNKPLPEYRGGMSGVVLSRAFGTLAESLRAEGYATAGFVSNPQIIRSHGFAQGFDHFDSSYAHLNTPGNIVNEAALAWLAQQDGTKPVFVFLHYMDVHGPYNAGPEYLDALLDGVEKMEKKHRLTDQETEALEFLYEFPPVHTNLERHKRLAVYREYWMARYEAGVRQIDRHLSDLRSRLKEMGLWDDAYVIITSDHGEALCEHGFWAHGRSVHHPELHVPLILRWPKLLPAGRRVAGTVRLIDIMPTLEAQLGLPATEGMQGVSLTERIAGHGPAEPVASLAEGVWSGPKQRAMYYGDWKLVVNLACGKRELYNIATDPMEQFDVSARHGERVEMLDRMIEEQTEINSRLAAEVEVREVPLTVEQIKALKALGYTR